MPFDYLQNAATEEEVARWRALFEKEPDAAMNTIRRQVEDAVEAFERSGRLTRACRADAEHRLASHIEELTRMSEALPVPTSVFRSASDAHAVGEVYRMIACLESTHRALPAPQPSFEALAKEAQACRRTREETVLLLGCAKQAARGMASLYGSLSALAAEFDAACARFGDAATDFAAWQRAWMAFCRVRLPRFSEELARAADLSHEGAKCDVAAVRRLCGELRFAAENL